MVIDLQRCVGCGACAFACKAENNTRTRGDGQSFNWADFVMKTEGTFPNVTHWVMPVLCNHCSDAPCVEVCPTEPKAMFKTPEGVTMHDTTLCIGCRALPERLPVQRARAGRGKPRTARPTASSASTPTDKSTQPHWADTTALIPGCTSLGRGRGQGGRRRRCPAMNAFAEGDVAADAQPRTWSRSAPSATTAPATGLQPACVEVCPSKARIFGDQDDPKREIAQVLKAQKSFRLQGGQGHEAERPLRRQVQRPRLTRARTVGRLGAGRSRPLLFADAHDRDDPESAAPRARTSAASWRPATTSRSRNSREEKLFDSMAAAARAASTPSFAAGARRARRGLRRGRTSRRCWSTTRGSSSARSTRWPSPTARSGWARRRS